MFSLHNTKASWRDPTNSCHSTWVLMVIFQVIAYYSLKCHPPLNLLILLIFNIIFQAYLRFCSSYHGYPILSAFRSPSVNIPILPTSQIHVRQYPQLPVSTALPESLSSARSIRWDLLHHYIYTTYIQAVDEYTDTITLDLSLIPVHPDIFPAFSNLFHYYFFLGSFSTVNFLHISR